MQIRILTFLITPGSASLQTGTDDDDYLVEKGIAIEGISPWGNDDANVDAVDAVPLEQSQARQEIKEDKKPEDIET